MKFRQSIDLSDLLLNIASSAFAFACAFFAGFMLLKVEGGRGGPEALPVTVAGAQLRAAADPLITGSVTPAERQRENTSATVVPPATYQAPASYKLLSVIDGTAFIEIADISGTRIWPVAAGDRTIAEETQ